MPCRIRACLPLLILVLVAAPMAAAQEAGAGGRWAGHITLPTGRLDVAVTLQREAAGTWTGTVDIPAQGARGLPLGDIVVDGAAVSFRILAGQGTPTFTGRMSDDRATITGSFAQGGNTLPFELRRGDAAAAEPAAPRQWAGEPVALETPTGALHGTLRLPSTPGPHPVALIIAGSGPTDRHGNSALLPGRNDSLGLLADALAQLGVASLRYDKRGAGDSRASAPPESEMRFETLVDDAAGWVRRLREDGRFATVSVIGHSEGSLVGMLAVERAGADAFVSIAGVGRRAPEVIRDQLRPQLPPDLWEESERILAALDAGRTVDVVPQPLLALFRPSVQPYLVSWFRHDPVEAMGRLRVPVLVAQGTTDIQVPVGEAHALEAARPHATLVLVEGMNHVLKMVPDDPVQQQASYGDPDLPISPVLAGRVAGFLAGVTPAR